MKPANDNEAGMPLYPSEAQIARAVLGSRAKDWPSKARFLEETEGLPKVDPNMGGRHWPSVVAFFNMRHNLPVVAAASGTSGHKVTRVRVLPSAGI